MPPCSLPARDGHPLPRRALVAGLLLALAGPGWAGDAGEALIAATPTPDLARAAAFTPAISVTATQAKATENGMTRGLFTFSRSADPSNPRPGALTVGYTLSGSATAGSDYQPLGASISFPAGALTVTKSVIAVQDKFQEPDETVILTVQPGPGYLAPLESAKVTIVNDDPITQTVTVAASDPSAKEDGKDNGVFTFTRSGNTAAALTVSFAVGGSATAGSDYAALGTSVSFAAGQRTATKTVTGVKDTLQEPAETVIVTLKDSSLYAPGTPTSATVTIANDPTVTQTVSVIVSDTDATEDGKDPGAFTFTRRGYTADALTVNFAVDPQDTATPDKDYKALGSSVTFAAGKTTATKTVTGLQDRRYEPDEHVSLYLREGPGYQIAWDSPGGLVTLRDDDRLNLNDTGSVRCSNEENGDLDCPVAGYRGQDAEYGRDRNQRDNSDGLAGFSYTKLSNSGKTLPASARLGRGTLDWACTRDNVTGLVWEVKTSDGGLRDQRWTYSWYQPDAKNDGGFPGTPDAGDNCLDKKRCDTAKYVADVNKARLCGFSDWRLPDQFELTSLLVRDGYEPAIDPTFFPNTLGTWYWTETTASTEADAAWVANFNYGDLEWDQKLYPHAVRLVR